MIALTGASFVSCSKESTASRELKYEQDHEQYLVGKWKVIGQRESGNIYNCLYRIEGDYFVEFKEDGSATCHGDAKAHAYYDGKPEFLTEDIGNYLQIVRWSIDYNSATGFSLWTYRSPESATSDLHKVEFNDDGTIKIWYHLMSYWYYTLKKVQ